MTRGESNATPVRAALPPGVVEVRYVRSESSPEKRYRMGRTRGGWTHLDGTCPAWTEKGACRHVDELNEEPTGTMETMPIVVKGDPLAAVEELESCAIIESLAGKVNAAWVYAFRGSDGKQVSGLSTIGVDQAARSMATKGEVLRIIDCHIEHEDDREARFFATAGRYAVNANGRQVLLDTSTGAKRQPKYGRRRDGSEYFIEHWYEIGNTKACRNAKAKLLNDDVRQHIIDEALRAGKAQPVRGDEERRPSAPARSASRGRDADQEIGKLRHDAGKVLDEYNRRFGDGAYRDFVQARCPDAVNEYGSVDVSKLTAEQCRTIIADAQAIGEPANEGDSEGVRQASLMQ